MDKKSIWQVHRFALPLNFAGPKRYERQILTRFFIVFTYTQMFAFVGWARYYGRGRLRNVKSNDEQEEEKEKKEQEKRQQQLYKTATTTIIIINNDNNNNI